jgi:hypothetical protein
LRSGRHHCAHLQAAWTKYGEEVFVFHVVETLPDITLLQDAEDKWLVEWVGKPECYNHGLRSGAPWRGSPKEKHPRYGKEHSDGTKTLLRKARLMQSDPRLGKKHSPETIQKMREQKLANPTKAWLGKARSEETRKKIGDAQRGVPKAPRTFTPEGLKRAQENMRRNAKPQLPADFSTVKATFPLEVLDKYNFENAVYTGAANRIQGCVCPKHGLFTQYAYQFKKGRGCPTCGAEQRAESKRHQMKQAWQNPEEREKMIAARNSKKDCTRQPLAVNWSYHSKEEPCSGYR